jgi:hypothetical protein
VPVWVAFSASDAVFAYLRRVQGREVVERGINDALADADQALAWNAAGKKDPDDVGPEWEKRLSGGAVVRLVGVSRPGEWKDCWWDAAGRAVAWDPRWDTGGVQGVRSPTEVAAAVSVEDPGAKDPRGLRGYGSAGRGLAAGVVNGEAVEVGVGDGAWTEAGRVQVGETVEAGGVAVKVLAPMAALHRNGASPGVTVVKWEAAASPEVEVWVLAYDKGGKVVADSRPPQILLGKAMLDGKVQEMQATEEIDANEIGGYVVRWRKWAWVRFEKFATMPAEMPGGSNGAASQRAVEVVKADSPEGFLAEMRGAALSGDAGKVRGLMVLGEGQGAQAEQYASLMAEDYASGGALWSAAVKKFGEEETQAALGNVVRLPQAAAPEGLKWEVTGNRAKLVNNGRGNVVLVNGGAGGLVKVKGAWRVEVVLPQASATAPGAAEEMAGRLEQFASRQKEVSARRRGVAGEVLAGKYADAYGVRDALNGK